MTVSGLAEKMLRLPGLKVLEVVVTDSELVIMIETTKKKGLLSVVSEVGRPPGPPAVALRDLPCFGWPTRLVWNKRRWRCRRRGCVARTWTEHHQQLGPRDVLTPRAVIETARQVGH